LFGDPNPLTSYDRRYLLRDRSLSEVMALYPMIVRGAHDDEERKDEELNASSSEPPLLIYGRGVRLGLSIESLTTDRCLSMARFITAKVSYLHL
jgi:hypothetical protein